MKVYILPECKAEIMHYVDKATGEVSGLGRVQKTTNGDLMVTKVYLLDQENTGSSTDLDEDAVAKLMYESREDEGDLNFWWHSHVNMGVFWSGTDMETIRQFGKNGYLLSTVFNKKNEHRTSYFQGGNDFLPELFVDNIPTNFSYLPSEEQYDEWEANFKAKCKRKPIVQTSYYGTNASGFPSANKGGAQGLGKQKNETGGKGKATGRNASTGTVSRREDAWERSEYGYDYDDYPLNVGYKSGNGGNGGYVWEEWLGVFSGMTAEEILDEVKSSYVTDMDLEMCTVTEQLAWKDLYHVIFEMEPEEELLNLFAKLATSSKLAFVSALGPIDRIDTLDAMGESKGDIEADDALKELREHAAKVLLKVEDDKVNNKNEPAKAEEKGNV